MYPYPATSRPLIKPFKSKARQEHRNLTGPADVSYAQQPYFGGAASTSHVDPMTSSHQTFRDMPHIPISTDPSSIPMTEFGQTSYANAYSSGAAAAVASVSSVMSTVPNNQQPPPPPRPVDGGSPNSIVNTHPMVTNYLMSNSEQLQQSTTPPSQYASPQSAGYGNPSPGYESELTSEFIGGPDPIMATSSATGVVASQGQLSPQNYNNHLATTSAVVSSPPQQQLPSYNSKFNNYNGMDAAPPVSVYGTSAGSTRPLQHLPYVAETSMSTGAGGGPLSLVNSDQNYHHRTSPPHMGSVSSGSPSSAYPSPVQPNNELHTNYIHSNGYAYSASSRTSPPSLTPSPESREDQLVNAHGTFHVEHHPHDFPTCHTHITPDSGMTMV